MTKPKAISINKEKAPKRLFGTKEWADVNYNFINGCTHDCKYCYSKEMAIRFERKSPNTWKDEELRLNDLTKTISIKNKLVMFPSSHDITPKYLNESISIIKKLLASKNKVLIVTKPHFECIKEICQTFDKEKKNILFRFTIGSSKSSILKFWEPGAPSFQIRLNSLKYAFEMGFKTSVSCEPMLDYNIEKLVQKILPFITDSIWIGNANFLIKRLRTNGITDLDSIQKANELVMWQSDKDNILKIYRLYKNNKKIKWKDSIQKILDKHI
ncbi:MAG: radical SAM protein [Bacteroidales bacterium]|jgi:DNA repair photolyase